MKNRHANSHFPGARKAPEPPKTSSEKLSEQEVFTLRLLRTEKENADLKMQLLQNQFAELKKVSDQLAKSWDEKIRDLQTRYKLDLAKDSIDLATGMITRNAETQPGTDEEDEEDSIDSPPSGANS